MISDHRSLLLRRRMRGVTLGANAFLVIPLLALAPLGCAATADDQRTIGTQYTVEQTQTSRTFDDISAIYAFYKEPIWVTDLGVPRGLRNIRVYFESQSTGTGEFVSGDIVVRINRITSTGRGTARRLQRNLVHEWRLDTLEARNFRIRTRAIGGDSYGFALFWPEEIDLSRARVEVVVRYEATDGRTVESPPRRFIVSG